MDSTMWSYIPSLVYQIDIDNIALEWCQMEHDGVSNHRRLDCLLHRLFSRKSKKIAKLRVTGLYTGDWIFHTKGQ